MMREERRHDIGAARKRCDVGVPRGRLGHAVAGQRRREHGAGTTAQRGMKGYRVATIVQNKIFYPINQELLLL
jgi:hypothetical protein